MIIINDLQSLPPNENLSKFSHSYNALLFFSGLILCLINTASMAQSDEQENKGRQQSGFLYGFASSIQTEIYEDFDDSFTVFPILGYRGEKLQVFGPFVSYSVDRTENFNFLLQLKPRFAGYDESDSDIFDGMEDREYSLDFGLGLNYQKHRWKVEVTSLHDILDRSDGTELSTKLSKAFGVGQVFIEPALSLSYLNSNHVDYYYGVEASEATSSRPEYGGDSAINSTLGVSFSTPIFFDGFTILSIENTWYDSSITDSPLVDNDSGINLSLIFTKFFDD